MTGLVYVVLFAVIIAFSSYVEDHSGTVLVTGTIIALGTLWRTWLALKFDTWYGHNPSVWRAGFIVVTLVLAGTWGLFCMIAVHQYGLEWTAMLVLLSTAGISSGAVTTLSIDMRLITISLALMLLPSIVAAAALQTQEAYGVMLMFATFFAFMLVVARRLNKEYWHGLNNTLLLDQRARELEASNQELASYSYSIAHDLRTPLRAIVGFSQVLLEDAGEKLNAAEKDSLRRVVEAGKHMARLIDDILELARIARIAVQVRRVDLSTLADNHARHLSGQVPRREAAWRIQPGVTAHGDPRLLDIVLQHLIGNAWKFTNQRPKAEIEFGSMEKDGETVYFVRDNGAGFDMKHSSKLFKPFCRMHRTDEFPGTGVGLATVQRIVQRHGGRVWAEASPNQGAGFFFVLGTDSAGRQIAAG